MKIIAAGVVLEKLIEDFSKRFPGLATKSGSFGKCKFLSYELALYLRRRGVKAKLLHVQGLKKGHPWAKTAHQTWIGKARKDWSHYVVAVGSIIIDLTARQFDSKIEHPSITTRHDLGATWETVEPDAFLNKVVQEVLRAQTDANRVMREGAVKKVDITPKPSEGRQQQKLRTPA